MRVRFEWNLGEAVWEVCLFALPMPMPGLAGEGGVYASGPAAGSGVKLYATIQGASAGSALCPAGESVWSSRVGPRGKERTCCDCVTTAEW